MQICIFEDEKTEQFNPLTYSRPVYELVCGVSTLREKISRAFPKAKVSLHCRSYLEETLKNQNPKNDINKISDKECLFINGRILFNEQIAEQLKKIKDDKVFLSGKDIVAVKLLDQKLSSIKNKLPNLFSKNSFGKIPSQQIDATLTEYIWDLIKQNPEELVNDTKYFSSKVKRSKIKIKAAGVQWVNRKNIFIKNGVKLKPGVVLDATNGPIFIDKNAIIHPNVVIEGPVYIGENTIVKSGATLYANVSIGKNCKVGGEIEDTIMLPYSNKQHLGFIGHAYLGSWVNLGANTNCSDLKNNYGNIKVKVNNKLINTNTRFLGTIIGDHSKTAINTMLNTGTVIGFSSNIYGAGFPNKYIPSFSWGGCQQLVTYQLEKAEETASIVFERRNKAFNNTDKKLFQKIFDITKIERQGFRN
ncbi:MAG: hypothetical protein COW08_04130 [Ignavibacteriales bacterium CG12_big_fil_rev_8_21_14_0_65_30_8]|nr:MAG: hypothetical protein COW08_04130 [Ignavibacteriales bacterium CG12_big_fil_rev_8_21_14_0_65_30_8]